MIPTVLRDGPFRLFFFSREEPRPHVPVAHPHGEAKFSLEPEIELATSVGMPSQVVAAAEKLVHAHSQEILHAWYRHFPR